MSDTVAAFYQRDTSKGAWVDVVGNSGKVTTLRLFTDATERWEFRNNGGTWDIYYIDSNGVGGTVLSSTGIGSFNIASLGTPTGASVDLVVDNNGNVYKQSSSVRYKENVKPLTEDFAKVMSLTPVSFTYKGGTGEQIGYTAEEVETAGLSHLVTHDGEGRPEAVSYKHLGIYAIELLKQQQRTIEELRSALSALEERLAS